MAEEAKSGAKHSQGKKKRRLKLAEESSSRPGKSRRVDSTDEVEGPAQVEEAIPMVQKDRPWRNLQLILLLQNKDVDVGKKVEIALDYVRTRSKEECTGPEQDCDTVKLSRVIVFLSDWIQSLLISSGKKVKVHGEQHDVVKACLDVRCWEIFKFCLDKSSRLQIPLNFSRKLLQPIQFIARHVLFRLNDSPMHAEESFLTDEFELFNLMVDCVSLLYASDNVASNESLEQWISAVHTVIELVNRIFTGNLDSRKAGVLVLQFSCFVLGPFAKFLRIHPTRKSGFSEFVHELLEPLLQLFGHLRGNRNNPGLTSNLLRSVDQVLSNGVFHPIHVEGFLTLHSSDKYLISNEGKSKDSKIIIMSYHRHLFEELERIMTAKKVLALKGVSNLFHLLVKQVRKLRGASVPLKVSSAPSVGDGSKQPENGLFDHRSKMLSMASDINSERDYSLVNLSLEARKSLFDFFVQIMEPLLIKLNSYLHDKMEVEDLLNVQYILGSVNWLLRSIIDEKVYVKTEDISGGAFLGFLKEVYHTMISLSANFNVFWQSKNHADIGMHEGLFSSVVKELVTAIGCLLDIEYEVIGEDLESLWHLLLVHLATGLSVNDLSDGSSLISKILDLGCQLVSLFGELRQVSNVIFSLSKAARLLANWEVNGEINPKMVVGTHASYEAYVKSVGTLLCSQEFKVAVHKAISSIPEGQASGCIQQLAEDVSESLIWMKLCCSKNVGEGFGCGNLRRCAIISFNLHCELLGKGLSEIYSCLLDSITVTTSNSVAVGSSINNLMAVIRPSLSSLVEPQSGSLSEFLLSLSGSIFDKKMINKIMSMKFGLSSHWAFVFFFRLYLSCRSLYRQAMSLMPPNSSIKMSDFMGDSFTACSGKDWIERDDLPDDGYFSWVVKPSASVLTVIKSVSDIYLQNSVADCCCLVYILYAVALQRLVDLNSQIKSARYLLQSKKELLRNVSLDGADHSALSEKCQKWEENVVNLRQEAQGLTDFIMRYLTSLVNDPVLSSYSEASTNTCAQSPHVSNQWDFGIGSIDEKTLLTAIWWIICQSTDIWCIHASKKNVKMFLYFLIQSSLPAITGSPFKCKTPSEMVHKSVHQISYEVLHDSTFHEHRFVHRHLASRLCRVMEKLAGSLFCSDSSGKVDLRSSPNWSHCLMELQKSLSVVSGSNHTYYLKRTASSSNEEPIDDCTEIRTSRSMNFAACMDLLNLFSRMPKDYLSSRSFKDYATHIINVERLAASSLLDFQGASFSSKHDKYFKLFLYCRKALKHLVEASFTNNIETTEHPLCALISEGLFSLVWLFKSVVVVSGLQDEWGEYNSCKVNLSLMDHTSYIFLMFSKYYFCRTLSPIVKSKRHCKRRESSGIGLGETNLVKPGSFWDSSKHSEAWKSICLVAQSMKEEMQRLFCSLEDSFHDRKADVGQNSSDVAKLSIIISCLSGFFWGLASAVDHTDAKDRVHKVISSHWKHEPLCKLSLFIDIFADVVSIFLRIMFGHEQSSKISNYSRDILARDGLSHSDSQSVPNISSSSEHEEVVTAFLESFGFTDQSVGTDVGPQLSHVEGDDCVASTSNEVNLFDLQYLNKPFLQQLLKDDSPDGAFLLRHLFFGYSAILKLNLKDRTLLSTTLLQTFMSMAQFLILELVNGFELSQPSSFVCLDGVLKYLEELGSHFPYTNPTLSRNVYARLIELQLVALGKCIVLQGKSYTLMTHETQSSADTIPGHAKLNGPKAFPLECCLDNIKARLRTSFTIYIKKPAELHLLSAIQAIERALVGVQECCMAKYGFTFGRVGGTVPAVVAAGIDLLDMLLENVSGRKRLSVVRRHIQSFMAALFNIILHVQSPLIFYESSPGKGFSDPDPGSVTLMCIEVLIRVSGRHALFQMDPWHVAQMLGIPAALFQVFCQSQLKDPISSGSLFSLENLDVDRPFSVKLYAACCRLLCTVLKHHRSECERYVALLQDSASVLLNCLETVNMDHQVRRGYLSWDVQEGVKCACSLRRIYEELRQQKDVYGRHCFKFLSSYVYTYSECGPLKAKFRREIDEALRPGVYALIDACSADDLQYLHTVFGEGPCRNTLASLQHDYKVYFRYEGKV
ncbi:uncharacterized protein LOC115741982 isoform X2 [Rhodamnia argentea]|uniref:Uncharacterized protein LOC115741982 isoform X2 n=1 Tax=Rhodamnia argentea TaxID=178133 RepID=A0A8B8PAV1_9MYRT|nr:uncharacterized protein LOC115741982 isoform X2 [Rhodamnia argentea]